jgi:hypothetical protein
MFDNKTAQDCIAYPKGSSSGGTFPFCSDLQGIKAVEIVIDCIGWAFALFLVFCLGSLVFKGVCGCALYLKQVKCEWSKGKPGH